MFVQAGLHHFWRIFEIVQQVFFRHVEDFDFDVFAEVGAVNEQLQATPRRFQRLEIRVVQNFVHLTAELGIDLSNHAVNHGLLDGFTIVLRLEQLFDKRRHATLGDVIGFVVRGQTRLGDDVVKNAVFAVFGTALLRCVGAHCVVFLG